MRHKEIQTRAPTQRGEGRGGTLYGRGRRGVRGGKYQHLIYTEIFSERGKLADAEKRVKLAVHLFEEELMDDSCNELMGAAYGNLAEYLCKQERYAGV